VQLYFVCIVRLPIAGIHSGTGIGDPEISGGEMHGLGKEGKGKKTKKKKKGVNRVSEIHNG